MRTIRESGVGSSEVVLVKCKYRSRSVKTNKQKITMSTDFYMFVLILSTTMTNIWMSIHLVCRQVKGNSLWWSSLLYKQRSFMRIYYGTIKPFVECANAIHHLSYVRETAHQGGISSVTWGPMVLHSEIISRNLCALHYESTNVCQPTMARRLSSLHG